MATQCRRARGAGAGAAGRNPLGILLALGAVGLLIKFWWVLLIALSVVALTLALVRAGRNPALPARARPPRTQDLTLQIRAAKQARHFRDMQEWDYEWIRLTYPAKSNREISKIAGAHFARGRSIGLDYGVPRGPRR